MSRLRFFVPFVCSIFVVAACSSSSDSSSDPCGEASQIVESCNAMQPDTGASVTITFDKTQCQQAGDQGKKAAQCIIDNKSNCTCPLKCSLSGSC
jgi:hypothetical protein